MNDDQSNSFSFAPPPPPAPASTAGTSPVVVPKWTLVVGVIAIYLGSTALAFGYVLFAAVPDKEFQDTYTFWQGLSENIMVTVVAPSAIAGAIAVITGSILVSIWGERSKRAKLPLLVPSSDPSISKTHRLGNSLMNVRAPRCLAIVGLLQLTDTIFLLGYQSGVEMPLHMPFADYGQGPLATEPEGPLYLAIFGVSAIIFAVAFLIALSARKWRTT